MRILGIDPGSRITGYGIVEKRGGRLVHVDNGCVRLKGNASLPLRLVNIYESLMAIIRKFKPESVALEEVFFSKNVASALKLGESRGIAILAASKLGIPISEYSATSIKQAITGYGQASKDQVQKMVQKILGLPQVAEENASDALAAAICHINTNQHISPPPPLKLRGGNKMAPSPGTRGGQEGT